MHKRSCDEKIFGYYEQRYLRGCSLLFATKKSLFLCFFLYKTRANTQQVLPEQTGLYRYDE